MLDTKRVKKIYVLNLIYRKMQGRYQTFVKQMVIIQKGALVLGLGLSVALICMLVVSAVTLCFIRLP